MLCLGQHRQPRLAACRRRGLGGGRRRRAVRRRSRASSTPRPTSVLAPVLAEHHRRDRPDGSLRMGGVTVPNVLATRYAAPDLVAIWSPEHKVVLERRLWIAVLTAQRDLGVDVPDGVVEAYEKVVGPGRPRLDRRPRAGHPARREGADRGVRRARRARAHPQGHDLARPHRERRAAPGPPVPGAGARPRGRRAGPAGQAGRRARDDRDGRPLAQRRGPGDDARQAVRDGGRRAAGRRSSGSRTCSTAIRCAASRDRWAPRRTCSTCSTATRTGSPSSNAGSPRHLGFERVLDSVGQVYPRSLDFDVVSALVQLVGGAVQPGHDDPADGRPRAGHRGLRRGPGRLRRRCPTR